MQISYGPPGHRGVTHLVAVGDDADLDTTTTEAYVSGGGILAMLAGALLGSKRVAYAGAGVAGGILLVRYLRGRRTVTVTTP